MIPTIIYENTTNNESTDYQRKPFNAIAVRPSALRISNIDRQLENIIDFLANFERLVRLNDIYS